MFERGSVGLRARRTAQIGIDVFDGSLQPVQTVVQPVEFLLGDDHLSDRHVERVRTPTRFVGPLPVRRAAEPPRTTGTRLFGQWPATPAAPMGVG